MVAEQYGRVRFSASLPPLASKQDVPQRDGCGAGTEGRALSQQPAAGLRAVCRVCLQVIHSHGFHLSYAKNFLKKSQGPEMSAQSTHGVGRTYPSFLRCCNKLGTMKGESVLQGRSLLLHAGLRCGREFEDLAGITACCAAPGSRQRC